MPLLRSAAVIGVLLSTPAMLAILGPRADDWPGLASVRLKLPVTKPSLRPPIVWVPLAAPLAVSWNLLRSIVPLWTLRPEESSLIVPGLALASVLPAPGFSTTVAPLLAAMLKPGFSVTLE